MNSCWVKVSYTAYVGSAELRRHERSKHLNLSYPCNNCDYKATDKGSLYRHKRERHEDPEVVQCEDCAFKTKNERSLKNHIKSKHKYQENKNCPPTTDKRLHMILTLIAN